jgi:hypothetical protein
MTEQSAQDILSNHFPDAESITPVPGNPNFSGWYLFLVKLPNTDQPKHYYVDTDKNVFSPDN